MAAQKIRNSGKPRKNCKSTQYSALILKGSLEIELHKGRNLCAGDS